MADSDLIIAFNNGDNGAFTSVYERLYDGIYFFAKNFVCADDAADITADVFFGLLKVTKTFKDLDSIKAYLIVSVRHACLRKLSREKNKSVAHQEITYRLMHDHPDWLDERERKERRKDYIQLIHRIVENLTEEKKAIFNMAFIEGFKNPEIAANLGLDEKQVRDAKSRILTFLRTSLSKKGAAVLFSLFAFLT